MVLSYTRHAIAQRAGHTRASPLRSHSRFTSSITEPHGPRQLIDEVLTVRLGKSKTLRIVHSRCLLDVFIHLNEMPLVSLPGLVIQKTSGVTNVGSRRLEFGVPGYDRQGPPLNRHQVQDMEFPTRLAQHSFQKPKTYQIVQQNGHPTESDSASVSFAAKDTVSNICSRDVRLYNGVSGHSLGALSLVENPQYLLDPPLCAKSLKRLMSSDPLHLRCISASELDTTISQHHAGHCRFVRSPDVGPSDDRGLTLSDCTPVVAFQEYDPALGECRTARETATREPGGDLSEFVRRSTRHRYISCSDRYFHLSLRQRGQTKPPERRPLLGWNVERVLDGITNQIQSSIHVALTQPRQDQPRLRCPCVLVRRQKCLFGTLEVALAETNVAELGKRPAKLPTHPGAQFLASL